MVIIGGSRGGCCGHVPPQQDQFLLFSHMFSPKSVRFRGWCPPNGSVPPQWEILDPPLVIALQSERLDWNQIST